VAGSFLACSTLSSLETYSMIGRPMTSQFMNFTLNSAIANCSDLQHRPRHPEQRVIEDDSEPDILHDISESEDVKIQEVVLTRLSQTDCCSGRSGGYVGQWHAGNCKECCYVCFSYPWRDSCDFGSKSRMAHGAQSARMTLRSKRRRSTLKSLSKRQNRPSKSP
jgi:hypothetical protein